MIWLYVGLAIFLAAAGGGVVWKYNGAIEEAAEAKAELVKANDAARGWKDKSEKAAADLERVQKTLAQRERDRRSLMEERDHARGTIEQLRKNPDVRRWADVEFPKEVMTFLTEPTPRGPAAATKSGLDGASTDAKK